MSAKSSLWLALLCLLATSLLSSKAARAQTTTTTLPGGVELTFKRIPAGEFLMGSTKSVLTQPVHMVAISRDFWLGETEVTQAQWIAVMGGLPTGSCQWGALTGNNRGDDQPIACVSWHDAQEFISRLNESSSTHKYRLPTEAEWEYAARAGTRGDFAGNVWDMSWFYDNAGEHLHEVATKQPNAWGLYDMHGNVAEWVEDWRDKYAAVPETDPMGPANGYERVQRGGGFGTYAEFHTSAARQSNKPDWEEIGTGLRVLLIAPPKSTFPPPGAAADELYRTAKAAYDRKDYAKSFPLLKQAAEAGHGAAQLSLATSYWIGGGVDEDLVQAFHWYQQAAERRAPGALTRVALFHEQGHGTPKNCAEAVRWYELAANEGDDYAIGKLASMYSSGSCVTRSMAEGFRWHMRGAALGNRTAQSNLALYYERGYGTEVDVEEALRWYRRVADPAHRSTDSSNWREAIPRAQAAIARLQGN